MTKEALKLALEALEVCEQSNYGRNWVWPDTAHPTAMANVKETITAIKEALAESEARRKEFSETTKRNMEHVEWYLSTHAPEPVAWMDSDGDVLSASIVDGTGLRNIPLYTTPPQRKPLTDEQIGRIAGETLDPWSCARAIEAAHGIKGDA